MTQEISVQLKVCKRCKQAKPIFAFADATKSGDHHSGLCVPCNKERLVDLNKARMNDEFRAKRRKYLKSVRSNPKCREREKRHSKKYCNTYPEKTLAKQIVARAIKSGALVRPSTCPNCGDFSVGQDGRTLIHAHHDDYTKPMDVRWLCVMCHSKEHRAECRALKENGNG